MTLNTPQIASSNNNIPQKWARRYIYYMRIGHAYRADFWEFIDTVDSQGLQHMPHSQILESQHAAHCIIKKILFLWRLRNFVRRCGRLSRNPTTVGVCALGARVSRASFIVMRKQHLNSVFCSVLQCAAMCCSVIQCVAVCCRVLPCVAECCRVLQFVAMCCSVLQCVAVCCSVS